LSSRSANEYLKSYDSYISDFKIAYQAMKQGDMSKYQSVIQRALELQSKSEKLAGELNPEEEQRFANYLNKRADELAQFTNQNR
jgi:flagellin-specific chaperone FliS